MTEENQNRRVTLTVTGMHCGSCAQLIQDELSEVSGVTSATVDYEAGRAEVTAAATVTDEALLAAVTAAGYQATVGAAPAAPKKKKLFGWLGR